MFKLIDKDSNYYAQIVFLNEGKKHENASSLYIWNVNNYNVITDLSYTKGQTCVFFPVECQINPQILSYLNMYEDKTLNQNKEKKGYIHPKGRVRAVKLRGEVSDGLLIDFGVFVKALNFCGANIGMIGIGANEPPFDHYGDIWICKKYIPIIKEARNSGTGAKVKGPKLHDFLVDGQFQFHGNTPKLQDNVHKIQPNDIIVLTAKIHGSSGVATNLLTKRKVSLLERLAKFFGIKVQEYEYSKMYSSRTVLKFIDGKYHTKDQDYYNNDIWGTVYEDIKDKIEEGVSLYYEIFGTVNQTQVQKGFDYSKLCNGKTYGVHVYRITKTDHNGNVLEFSWNQVKEYCKKHGLDHVVELYYGKAIDASDKLFDLSIDYPLQATLIERLSLIYLEKDCEYCTNKVPSEGICVRKETGNIEWWKLKSRRFLEWETKQLDKEEVSLEDEN